MSAAFTTVGSGSSYQPTSAAIYNELITALNERKQAINEAKLAVARVPGDDFQKSTLGYVSDPHNGTVGGMQQWLEGKCTSFIDDSLATAGDLTGVASSSTLRYTLGTWRTAAGLTSGFRRATAWSPPTAPTFSYGVPQVGDIFGPWIYEDLQAGFSALKWTGNLVTIPGGGGWQSVGTWGLKTSSSGNVGSCALAISGQDSDWSAQSWAFGYSSYNAKVILENPSQWKATGDRGGGQSKFTTLPTFRPSVLEEYAAMIKYGTNFIDVDGLGVAENTWHRFAAIAESSSATRTMGGVGTITSNPVTDAGVSCPTLANGGLFAQAQKWIFKWNFTNSN